MRHFEMKRPINSKCNAMPTMVVTSGSRCDLLSGFCRASPNHGLLTYGRPRESREGRKGWSMSKGIVRIPSLAGNRISYKNLLNYKFEGSTPCIAGSCSNLTGPELCMPFRKVLDIRYSRGILGKRNQARIERSWSRVHAKEVSKEIHEEESGDRGTPVKQINPIERTLRGGSSLAKGETDEQESSRLSNQHVREVFWDGVLKSEYLKIQDLKFSGDMWEGDSGPQVLDLQRMLYRFGYLPKRSDLTAYFGLETKRALQQFQISNGVPGTGAWGSSSRQALWKLLSEDNSSFFKGGSSVFSDLQQSVSSSVEYDNAERTDIGMRVSELMNNMGAHSQEFISTLSIAPYWRYLPMKVPRNAAVFGLLVGMLVALFGLGYSFVGFFHEQHHGQPVRRRVLRAHWRDNMSGTTFTKAKRRLDMFPGLDLPLVGEEDFKYRLRSKPKSSSMDGTGRTDRLILYEGLVLVGDETPSHVLPFMSGPASRRSSGKFASQTPSLVKSSSTANLASTDQSSKKSPSNGSSSGQRESQLYKDERNTKLGGTSWRDKDEESSKDHVDELRKVVQATEKSRQVAVQALADERQRSLELQVKISRQKETAAALEEEVRVLKESHDALLTSLRKKYSSTAAARAAAALLYQNWDTNYEEGSPQTLSF